MRYNSIKVPFIIQPSEILTMKEARLTPTSRKRKEAGQKNGPCEGRAKKQKTKIKVDFSLVGH